MAVFDRWRRYRNSDAFRAIFTREVRDLAREAFGDIAPISLA